MQKVALSRSARLHLCSLGSSSSGFNLQNLRQFSATKRTRLTQPMIYSCSLKCANDMSTSDQQQTPDYRQKLDFKANLTGYEAALSLLLSTCTCAAYYALVAPAQLSLRHGLSQSLLFAATLTVCRSWLLERKHQGRLAAEQELKDEDSVFRELHGTTVHYKLAQGIQPEHPVAMHFYHGFGANTFSWSYVYKALSQQLHAQITKHDMPGFGLTQRPLDISGYSLAYNGRLGRRVMDAELASAGFLPALKERSQSIGPKVDLADLQAVSSAYQPGQKESDPAPDAATIAAAAAQHASAPEKRPYSPISSLDFSSAASEADSRDEQHHHVQVKRVLVGHSLGAACAAAEVIRHSEDISGLVLVAPAITAFSSKQNRKHRADVPGNQQPAPQGSRAIRVATAVAKALASRLAGAVLWLIQPLLVISLRILVRSRHFWKRGLSNAWHSRDGVSDELLDAYRLPQLVRGWEVGLVRFVRAQFADDRSLAQVWKDAYMGKARKSQALQLADAVKEQGIKVLIVHGSRDRLVPLSNSRRLNAVLPNSELIELPDCGHVPQEELPAKFTEIVRRYVGSLA